MPMMLVPQLILGWLSVGLQPVERFPEWIQPFVRNQPISQFVYALRALAGDSTPAAGEVTWSVIGPALVWVVALDCDLAFRAARSALPRGGNDGCCIRRTRTLARHPLPRGPAMQTSGRMGARYRENSPRQLVSHTWVLTARVLRRWSRDPATVFESLIMPAGVAGDTGHCSRGRYLAGHRAQRSLRQRSAGRDGRSHDRGDGRRDRAHAGTHRRPAVPVVGGARAPGVGPAVETGGRCGPDRGDDGGHPVRRAGAGFSVPAGNPGSRWRGCSSRSHSGWRSRWPSSRSRCTRRTRSWWRPPRSSGHC